MHAAVRSLSADTSARVQDNGEVPTYEAVDLLLALPSRDAPKAELSARDYPYLNGVRVGLSIWVGYCQGECVGARRQAHPMSTHKADDFIPRVLPQEL